MTGSFHWFSRERLGNTKPEEPQFVCHWLFRVKSLFRERSGWFGSQLNHESAIPWRTVVLRHAAQQLYVHFPFHQPERLKDMYPRVETLLRYILFTASSRTFINETLFFFCTHVTPNTVCTTALIFAQALVAFTHEISTSGRNSVTLKIVVTSQNPRKSLNDPKRPQTTFENCWFKNPHGQTRYIELCLQTKKQLVIVQKSCEGTKVQKREWFSREVPRRNGRKWISDI